VGSVKKRGRPAGSKNKPKAVATKAKAVDWEKLCKHLQSALRDEFADNEKLVTKVKEMEFKVANLEHQAIGYRAVVSYLENKLGNDTV
jgi:hypothetical protein